MKRLRTFLFASAFIGICISILLFKFGEGFAFLGVYILVNGVIVIISLVFERKRYKTDQKTKDGWIRTKERFIDHSTGKLMEVFYNPKTGERSYREKEPSNSSEK